MKSNVKAAEKILEKAKSLTNNGQYDKALSLLNEGSNELRSYSIFHNMKGVCLQGLQEHDDAVKCFLEGIKINPLDPLPFTGIGNSLFKNLQYAESERYYELALVVDENYHDALVGIGAVAFQRSQYEKCEEFLKRALQQKPETVTTNTNLANSYSAQGRHDEALTLLRTALATLEKVHGKDHEEVTNLRHMFSEAHSFSQPLSTWDVSRVTNMSGMFSAVLSRRGSVRQSTNGDSVPETISTPPLLFRRVVAFHRSTNPSFSSSV